MSNPACAPRARTLPPRRQRTARLILLISAFSAGAASGAPGFHALLDTAMYEIAPLLDDPIHNLRYGMRS